MTTIDKILSNYESDTPGVKASLARMLNHGKLAGTGRLVIYPVDQGFEHGPVRSYGPNPAAYDPHYHFRLAIDAGLSAYAAPLGALEAGASTFAGQIPLILKMNSANTLVSAKDQAVTASIKDALRLGCSGIGFTIYPGSDACYSMFEKIRDLAREAKEHGLFVVIWSYPRGSISKEGETAVDIVSYGAHMATLLGAHIIKIKLPTAHIEQPLAAQAYKAQGAKLDQLSDRVREVVRSCFDGRRIVVFSGGDAKDVNAVLDDTRAIKDGGGHGSIIGRNCFQRPRAESLDLLSKMIDIYKK